MKTQSNRIVVSAAILLAACTSGGSSDAWSRSYLVPRDEVIDAVIDILEDEGYLVEADREKGRISAEPSGGRGANPASLVVNVARKDGRIRVDVQTRAGASYSSMPIGPDEAPILEFLHELDLRLHGGRG
jgi:hypothetical protein